MYDLESEWPAHNQGKTPGWLARENPIETIQVTAIFIVYKK